MAQGYVVQDGAVYSVSLSSAKGSESGFPLDIAFREAQQRSGGTKLEVLALLMGITLPQLLRQLDPTSREHLSLQRLLLLANDEDGRRFLAELWLRIADHIGIEQRDAIAQQLASFSTRISYLIDKLQARVGEDDLRMAKAQLRQHAEQQTA